MTVLIGLSLKLHNYDENKHVTYRGSQVKIGTMHEGDMSVEKEIDERIAG